MPFPTVAKEDICEKLSATGVSAGDIIYVAAFMPVLGSAPRILDDTIDALIETVDSRGTVVMPVFNWDYCKGEIFDPLQTPSQAGVLSETFRKRPGVFRSISPPWCTFAAWGARAEEIAAIKGTTPFGPDSVTQFLYDVNVTYVLLGCSYNEGVIHVHWLEEKYAVPYRFWKTFTGKIKINDTCSDNVSYMYARRLDVNAAVDSSPLTGIFDETEHVRKAPLGLGELRCFTARDYVAFMEPFFRKDKLAVLGPEARKHFE